jgi:ATP-binding cassette subfamily B protein
LRDLVVRFGDAEQDVLNIPSLDIGPGRSLAVVGSVGSGKSVLQNVLLGEIAPHRGSVELVIHWDANGAKRTTRLDVYSERGLQFLRKVASYAPQQSVVLSLTVRENVPLALDSRGTGESDLDDARIIAALGRVQLEQDLRAFPAGLDTLIGERGINLSGGQKQRLSLGRAEYFGRPLVVLDDPLSAVDRDTESALNALFFATDDQGHSEGADKRTLIVSTHRLSCVALCDDVLLLENGRVASFGPTQDLLKDDSSVTLWLRSHHES